MKEPILIGPLTFEWAQLLEERIGIMHFEGNLPIWKAEREANIDIRKLAKNEGN